MRNLLITMAIVLATIFAGTASAKENLKPTAAWLKQAQCIHRHESMDWHRVTDWLGYPSVDHGGMQIEVSVWQTYLQKYPRITRGYPSDPAWATPWQQLQVAYLIWRDDGWAHPWPNTSVVCGLA